MIRNAGRPVGGIFHPAVPPEGATGAGAVGARWLSIASVANMDRTVAAMTAGGAQVLVPATVVDGFGTRALLRDSQGAIVGLLQSSSGDRKDAPVETGEFFWVDLYARDPAAAARAYQQLGYELSSDEVSGDDRIVLSAQRLRARRHPATATGGTRVRVAAVRAGRRCAGDSRARACRWRKSAARAGSRDPGRPARRVCRSAGRSAGRTELAHDSHPGSTAMSRSHLALKALALAACFRHRHGGMLGQSTHGQWQRQRRIRVVLRRWVLRQSVVLRRRIPTDRRRSPSRLRQPSWMTAVAERVKPRPTPLPAAQPRMGGGGRRR